MSAFPDRVRGWYRASLAKLRRRSWKAWAVVVGVIFIVAEILRAVLSDAGTLLLVWLYHAVLWFGRQPMGMGGLVIVAFLLVLTGTAWWESRPKAVRQAAPLAPLSETERRLVQDIRTVWGRHGHLAIGQLHDLVRDTVFELDRRIYWASLLRPITEDLEMTQKEFVAVLDPQRQLGIGEIRDHFNAMYSAYSKAMKWVALLQAREQVTVGRQDDRLAIWRQNHRDMIGRLYDLEQDPEHKGTFAIHFHWIDEPEFRSFLTEAQFSEEWLALMRGNPLPTNTEAPRNEAAPLATPRDLESDTSAS